MPHEKEAKIIEICGREGTPLPKKIASAPELGMGLELYFDAFMDLSSCRQLGMGGVGPIPWTAMKAYADDFGLDEDAREELYYLMKRMDAAYIDWHSPKDKTTGGKFK